MLSKKQINQRTFSTDAADSGAEELRSDCREMGGERCWLKIGPGEQSRCRRGSEAEAAMTAECPKGGAAHFDGRLHGEKSIDLTIQMHHNRARAPVVGPSSSPPPPPLPPPPPPPPPPPQPPPQPHNSAHSHMSNNFTNA